MRRALHYVFRVAERNATYKFYTEILGMKVLRHEEFKEGCKATCNGPYDGMWSKTMVGYGPEDSFFAIELTFNYGISSYKLGNDFGAIWIQSSEVLNRARQTNLHIEEISDGHVIKDPDGHAFVLIDSPQPHKSDPIKKIRLNVSDLHASVEFWQRLCSMQLYEEDKQKALLGYSPDQCLLELHQLEGFLTPKVDRTSASGRIAFSCPENELKKVESDIREHKHKVLTPLTTLETPGKAAVQVIIFCDPNDHEICFVGDEAFCKLSQIDLNADHLIRKAMEEDKSRN